MVDYLLRKKLTPFLEEDLALGDITTEMLIEPRTTEAEVIAREGGVIAGMAEARELLGMTGITVLESVEDGQSVGEGDVVIRFRGINRSILMVERTLLNIISRMSGIASITSRYIEIAKGISPDIRIAATRKTAPGLRWLDKKAVTIGGGDAHRIALHDSVLIKDNHIDAVGDVATAITRARARASFVRKIEVEVSTTEDAVIAIEAGADVVMLDNMSVSEIEETMEVIEARGDRKRVIIEASGNVNMDSIGDIASTGVDVISIGSLTHSVRALDLALSFSGSNRGCGE